MPFYEYQCSACGHHHEELQKVSDRPMRKCPACGRTSLRRLVSAPVFRLKGSGWYETDFKKDQEAKRNLAGEREPAAEKPAEEKPKADKPESKPAEKKAEAEKPANKAVAARKPTSAAGRPKAVPPKPASGRRRSARR